jgi:signal peptidase I
VRFDFSTTLREYKGFILFIFLMVVFRSAIADWNDVPSSSMEPTILTGDRILVNKVAYDLRVPLTHVSLYRHANPQRGEIVIFDSKAADRRLVKRVIGVPGDTVQMVEDRLLINGVSATYQDPHLVEGAWLVAEGFEHNAHTVRIDKRREGMPKTFGPVTVPPDHYLMLGDNRHQSADSRAYGFVPRDEIVGRSRTVVLSLDPGNFYLPRVDRFVDPL